MQPSTELEAIHHDIEAICQEINGLKGCDMYAMASAPALCLLRGAPTPFDKPHESIEETWR
jgi:hypothetical protein